MKLNRIKLVLVENEKTNKWLSERIGKSQVTISRWCSNLTQPNLSDLWKVAEVLEVDVRCLINTNQK